MESYNLVLTFIWDSSNDVLQAVIEVPEGTGKEAVLAALKEDHEYLDNCCSDEGDYDENEDEDEKDADVYPLNGRTPETLVNFTCEKRGWKWHEFMFDDEIEFD